MIHLDTSFLIRSLVRGSAEDRHLRSWIAAGELLGVAAPAWAEFLCGPVGPVEVAAAMRILGQPVSFAADEAEETARLFNLTGRKRGSLVDCMIAATAVRAGAAVATCNAADFRKLQAAGLRIVP